MEIIEKQYEIDSKEFNKETIDWSKNHTEYLGKWYSKLNHIMGKQFPNGKETVEVDFSDLNHINQLMVDSIDIIDLLKRIITKQNNK